MANKTKENQSKILKSYEYVKKAYNQDKKSREFLKKCTIFNRNTGELKSIKFNKEWHLRQAYLYNTFRIDYLNRECLDNGFVPIFVTLTLPSEYHQTKKITLCKKTKKFKLIPNKNYNPSCTVEDGYNLLNKIFRDLYNNFRVNSKRSRLKFIRVIEPHASFTPHLHGVVYVEKNNVYKFMKHFIKIKNTYSLKQVDLKILDTAKYAVAYLLKYVDKTLRGDDTIRGWRIHHKINRVLTLSNLNNGMTRDIFKRITEFVPFDLNNPKEYLSQILDKITINRTVLNEVGTIKKHKIYKGSNSIITVDITYKIKRNLDELTHDEEINLIDENIYEDRYTYDLLYLSIKDDLNNKILYNKLDYVFYNGDIDVYRYYDDDLCLLEFEEKNIITVGDLKNEY